MTWVAANSNSAGGNRASDAAPFGDFTYYLSSNFQENFGDSQSSYFSLTPGFRTHLGHNFFLLGGVEIPLTGPQSFSERFTLMLVKGF